MTMGSTLAFRIGFEHGRRKNALAEGMSRSAAVKRVRIMRNRCDDPEKRKEREKGVEERETGNGDGLT
jgi:hypothetical protein